ncbi:NAD(P)H-binding protein [Acinetobacter tianfuensis]|uniref:NAD-dependent epimerase/dehydratase family protein n=1 Tax=Acinetobacter tianfuensis TaxID=2419603 RepID=A0A3A8ETP3_9GAMM|nr:NAD(P)H-binding protein [Acinetobacter tianfuensis]RKG34090.1 NAD-dependent epimerase/dehydratase family protein [Acinetobacter tianfuensis]
MSNSIDNAIVIGATGLVGRKLIQQLSQASDCRNITAVVRKRDPELDRTAKVQQFVLDDFTIMNHEDVSGYTHAFSCLGTTMKKAGSKEQFYNTDFVINAHFAELLETAPIHFILLSAMGANTASPFFYNRVKGELEYYVKSLNLARTSIIQPSLLLGVREEQRKAEDAAQRLYRRFSHLVPDTFKYKPVTAEQVAHTMVEAAHVQTERFHIYDNLRIQKTR